MASFFALESNIELQRGSYNAAYKWKLPGITCPECKSTWSWAGLNYPAVDLTNHPNAKRLERARLEEDFEEFERLRESIRPLLPPGAPLGPGMTFGPLVGTARGPFSAFVNQYGDVLLLRPDVLEKLQNAGVRGLRPVEPHLRYRSSKNTSPLWDLHIESRGLLHPDGRPPAMESPCPRCGRYGASVPRQLILAKSSLPEDRDLFRLPQFPTVLIVTGRFFDVVKQHGFDGMGFREVTVR